MQHVLTLITRPGELDDTLLSGAEDALGGVAERVWLGDGEACGLLFESGDPDAVRAAVARRLAAVAVDWAIQPVDGRRKKLLLADLESTLIANEMLDEMAEFIGIRPQIEAITARAMNGEIDFSASVRERVALLADLPTSVLDRALEQLVVNPGAATLIATLRRHGVYTAIVTGGFSYFAERVQRQLGCDSQHSNALIVDGDRLTGQVREPIFDAEGKRLVLEELAAKLGCTPEDAAAVGDGANDLQMLDAAGLGVAYHAKPRVVEAARYSIRHGDLTALLYLQGYPRETWIERPDPRPTLTRTESIDQL